MKDDNGTIRAKLNETVRQQNLLAKAGYQPKMLYIACY